MEETETFLETTSAHGLRHLRHGPKYKRLLWTLVCLASYSGLVVWTAKLLHRFRDPHNLTTGITIESLTGGYNDTGGFRSDDVYPRPVLCIPSASPATWDDYRAVRLISWSNLTWKNVSDADDVAFDFRPTVFDLQSAMGLGSDVAVGLCGAFDGTSEFYSVFWNGLRQLDLYITMSGVDGAPIYGAETARLTNDMSVVVFTVTDLESLEFFDGPNYTESYPDEFEEEEAGMSYYDETVCLDACFFRLWRERFYVNASDPELIEDMLHYQKLAVQRRSLSKTDWRATLANICGGDRAKVTMYFPYHFVCDFRGHRDADDFHKYREITGDCRRLCKRRKRIERFRLKHEILTPEKIKMNKLEDFTAANKTEIWFPNTCVKRTVLRQQRRMTLLDMVGLIGGYMGLLIGASVLTILEFLEYFVHASYTLCFWRKKRCDKKSPTKMVGVVEGKV